MLSTSEDVMPKFGPRKIGHAQFEAEEAREKVQSKFGPRKFGKRKAAEMAAAVAVAESVVEEERAVEPARVVDGEFTAASIKQIDVALKENPALYEELYILERERPDGGRKGAFRIFLAMAMALEGGPRDERMAELEERLKPKK